MISITLRHLIRHWRLNLTVLLSLALGSTILISLSGYEAAISNQELQRALTLASPAGRSLLITGSLYTFDETLYQNLQNSLGTVFKERIEIRHATLQADPQPAARLSFNRIDVYSFDSIGGHVRIVEGRLPEPLHLSEAVGPAPPQVEAVIGVQAAEQAGYRIGERITATNLYHRFKIVGIVEPIDDNDDAWGGDLSAFRISGDMSGKEVLPLIIAPESMRSNLLKPIFPHQISWRITLDTEHIQSEQVNNLRANLINFEAQAGTRGAVSTSDLVHILDDHQGILSPVQTVFFLLGLQSAVILLFALAALASTKDQSLQSELSTCSARGASLWQIIGPTAMEAFIISMLAALVCGPGLAQVLILLWNRGGNPVALRLLSGDTWPISAILAGAGWLALTLPVLSTSRHAVARKPPQQKLWMQRYHLDVYLFAFGSLLTWQLRQSGSFLARQLANNSRLFDPLLIAGPSLMLVACAMLAIRLLPNLARYLARVVGRWQGSVLYLGFLRITRDSRHSGWLLLLAGMVSAQSAFNLILIGTLASNPVMLQGPSLGLGLSRALSLNSLTLTLFTFSLFSLLSWLMLQERLEEFQVLRTLGLSPHRGRLALSIEYLPSLLLGVLLGTILGLGLSLLLFPYLTQPLGKVIIDPQVVDWWALARLDAILFFTFGAALFLPLTRMPAQGLWTSPQGTE